MRSCARFDSYRESAGFAKDLRRTGPTTRQEVRLVVHPCGQMSRYFSQIEIVQPTETDGRP